MDAFKKVLRCVARKVSKEFGFWLLLQFHNSFVFATIILIEFLSFTISVFNVRSFHHDSFQTFDFSSLSFFRGMLGCLRVILNS